MFEARAEFVVDLEEKRRALALMIVHADPDAAAALRERLVTTSDLAQVTVIRLMVVSMGGKQGQ
jgi:nitroimidazol reductase NimA-like FMN-containing flavoprotein (pyridoxamine 5'-phosphate oxidase superfamily)